MTTKLLDPLMAISPLDGRYGQRLSPLRTLFSEYALFYYRTLVEIRWFEALTREPAFGIPALTDVQHAYLDQIISEFSLEDAEAIKAYDRATNHDVKAVEYYLASRFEAGGLSSHRSFIHFACTSEDINNLAYGLILKAAKGMVLKALEDLILTMIQQARAWTHLPMLARTHGQTASPTTLGKEWMNVVVRLKRQYRQLEAQAVLGKINGATGNFNAHWVAYPDIDWPAFSENFVTSLDLTHNPLTTQIEPHDYIAELCHTMVRINTILIDLSRDVWGYISLDYFSQKVLANETGSSTMPHKVNPIDFENAEGNLGVANALFSHLASKLPISRWQRDLSDSTVLRNTGTTFAYSLLGISSLQRGLDKLEVNEHVIEADLKDRWEVLTEALQTVMRRYQIPDAYERLKSLSRGKRIDRAALHEFLSELPLPEAEKARLKALTPTGYTGLARELAESKIS